jgi:hypothetical protein
MNPVARTHLERAGQEILGLQAELEGMFCVGAQVGAAWQTRSWLEARGFARCRAKASLWSWVEGIAASRVAWEAFREADLAPDEVGLGLLAPAQRALTVLSDVISTEGRAVGPEDEELVRDRVFRGLVERNLPRRIEEFLFIAEHQRGDDLSEDDAQALWATLLDRVGHRMVCAELDSWSGPGAGAALAERYHAWCADHGWHLAALDQDCSAQVQGSTFLRRRVAWIEREFFHRGLLDLDQLDVPPRFRRGLGVALERAWAALGLTDPMMSANHLPWDRRAATPGGWI